MLVLRPRFSLLTILLVMALVACGITIWQLWREVGPLRVEVRTLRGEVGRLSIDDPTKLHAIQVRQTDELVWKWRLWIPAGHSYVLHTVGGKVPHEGFPPNSNTLTISHTGETWVEYRIAKNANDGHWWGMVAMPGVRTNGSEQPWVDWRPRVGSGECVGETTETCEPDKAFLLGRYYYSQSAARGSQTIEDPASGFMIWLEPR
jgi:hypothetical protein